MKLKGSLEVFAKWDCMHGFSPLTGTSYGLRGSWNDTTTRITDCARARLIDGLPNISLVSSFTVQFEYAPARKSLYFPALLLPLLPDHHPRRPDTLCLSFPCSVPLIRITLLATLSPPPLLPPLLPLPSRLRGRGRADLVAIARGPRRPATRMSPPRPPHRRRPASRGPRPLRAVQGLPARRMRASGEGGG